MMIKPILSIRNLTVSFATARGAFEAVRNLSFSINPGEILGIVGESGSGKSVTSLAVMGLLPPYAETSATQFEFQSTNLFALTPKKLRKIRGNKIAMIFQDPMTSLNPCYTVGYQLTEVLRIHGIGNNIPNTKKNRMEYATDLLNQVGIPSPSKRIKDYPHQLSGGMSQRVMIAMAIACKPDLLIADEPTTALDVTIQSQILNLIQDMRQQLNMTVILISHDIGLIAEHTSSTMVMYAGQAVETGPTMSVIKSPIHPYTQGLLNSLPGMNKKIGHKEHIPSIPGIVPDLVNRPQGCSFHPRCEFTQDKCQEDEPEFMQIENREGLCHFPLKM